VSNENYPPIKDDFQEIVLRMQRFTGKMAFTANTALEVMHDPEHLNALILYLTKQIPTLPGKEVVKYPSSWWDAVKERFAPQWFLKRYPSTFVTVVATTYFPDNIMDFPKELGHPRIMLLSERCRKLLR
jgi:hypothetical protein